MSVLIKGIDIPKNCYDCQLNKDCDARWFLEIDRRPYDCPLGDVQDTVIEEESEEE